MSRPVLLSADQAAGWIPAGATVSVCGAWMLVPDALLAALERRFLHTGQPAGLSAIFLLCPGGTVEIPGIDRLAHRGLLRRTIGGSYPNIPGSPLRALIAANEIEAHNLPAGMMAGWLREIGAGRPGAITSRGIGTFVDPRQHGGRMNAAAERALVSVMELDGVEHLFLPSMRVDVALIRASTADEAGNLTMEDEPASLTAHVQAAAARASGGKVIAQVRRVVPAGSLNPHAVRVPGFLVDCLVVEPDAAQAPGIQQDASLCAHTGTGPAPVMPDALGAHLARRALAHLRPGDAVVLGYGVSAYVPHLLLSEGRFHDYSFLVEQGSSGGLPLPDFGFGCSRNPLAILDGPTQLDLFQGGCFDVAMLSFLQVDPTGAVNVHHLAARPERNAGIGGFLDIASGAPRLVFVGYFTAGGLDVHLGAGGRLEIRREGKVKKFVRRLDQVSYLPSGSRANEIVFVSERATFRLENETLTLVEVAPGVDVERDILAHMEFAPRIAAAVAAC